MNEAELVIVVVITLFVALVCWTIVGRPKFFKLPKFDLAKHRTIKKEKDLLADLVKDMRANPGHWVRNGYSPVTFQGPMIVNDYSSIGIQYGERTDTPTTILIHFNLENKTTFDQGDENSIATRIDGKHAQKFINTVTTIMDERGKELDYFRSRINERL